MPPAIENPRPAGTPRAPVPATPGAPGTPPAVRSRYRLATRALEWVLTPEWDVEHFVTSRDGRRQSDYASYGFCYGTS